MPFLLYFFFCEFHRYDVEPRFNIELIRFYGNTKAPSILKKLSHFNILLDYSRFIAREWPRTKAE